MVFRVGVFYLITRFLLVLFGGLQEATGILPPQIGLAQWGPGVAALLTLVIFRSDGLKITLFSKDTPGWRYLWAAMVPGGVGLIVFLIRSLIAIIYENQNHPYWFIISGWNASSLS
jgi:hypothetical protein